MQSFNLYNLKAAWLISQSYIMISLSNDSILLITKEVEIFYNTLLELDDLIGRETHIKCISGVHITKNPH